MPPSLIALTVPEWLDAAVAVGTGALALATFVMVKAAREQAIATRRLAEIAKRSLEVETRHVEATTVPVLRVLQGGIGLAQDDALWLVLVNSGAAPATIERVDLSLPGGRGATRGSPAGGDTADPSGGQVSIQIPLSPEQQAQATSGGEVIVTVAYTAPGLDLQRSLQITLKAKDGGDRWVVLRELPKGGG